MIQAVQDWEWWLSLGHGLLQQITSRALGVLSQKLWITVRARLWGKLRGRKFQSSTPPDRWNDKSIARSYECFAASGYKLEIYVGEYTTGRRHTQVEGDEVVVWCHPFEHVPVQQDWESDSLLAKDRSHVPVYLDGMRLEWVLGRLADQWRHVWTRYGNDAATDQLLPYMDDQARSRLQEIGAKRDTTLPTEHQEEGIRVLLHCMLEMAEVLVEVYPNLWAKSSCEVRRKEQKRRCERAEHERVLAGRQTVVGLLTELRSKYE